MIGWLALLLHAGLVALAAPLLDGLLRQMHARHHGHPAPPTLQPWHDLVRLWRKPPHRPAGRSFVMPAAPAATLALAAVAALLTPGLALGMATAPAADLVVILAFLAASRFVPALAALDAGDTLAATRISATQIPAEAVLMLAALVVMLLAGGTNVDAAAALRPPPTLPGIVPSAFAGLVLLAALAPLVGPYPPDPAIFSGRDLAIVTAAAQVRRVVSVSLAAIVGIPLGVAPPASNLSITTLLAAWLAGAAFWTLKLGVLGALAAQLARYRAEPATPVLIAAALLALIAAVIIGVQGTA